MDIRRRVRLVLAVVILLLEFIYGNTQACDCIHGTYGNAILCSRRNLTSLSNTLNSTFPCPNSIAIDVRDNKLVALNFPANFFQNHASESIRADKNLLTCTLGLNNWTGKYLDLGKNQLTKIDLSSIGKNLETLFVNYNFLSTLNLSSANYLWQVYANTNSLQRIILPETCALIYFDIRDNNMIELPDGFSRCSKLKELLVSNNYLMTISPMLLGNPGLRLQEWIHDDMIDLVVDVHGNGWDFEKIKEQMENLKTVDATWEINNTTRRNVLHMRTNNNSLRVQYIF